MCCRGITFLPSTWHLFTVRGFITVITSAFKTNARAGFEILSPVTIKG
jgi:hypothetical protein